MKVELLQPTELTVNIFGSAYMESFPLDFNGLINVVNMWRGSLYNVYAVMDEGKILGFGHGWCRGDDFFGHHYFSKECRGKVAKEGLLLLCERVQKDFDIKQVTTIVGKERKTARLFLKACGFRNEGDTFWLMK